MRKELRKPLIAVATLVLAGIVAGIAWASIPDGSGTIHACYSPSDKSLRVVDGACANGELPVTWSKDAIAGSQGQQGDQGLQGATGGQGLAGVTFAPGAGALVVTDSVIGGFFKSLTCPSGTKALDGTWTWAVLNGSKLMDEPVAVSWPVGDDEWALSAGADSAYNSQPIILSVRCIYAR